MSEVRFHDRADERREHAVKRLQEHVGKQLGNRQYDVDIEHFDEAVAAFAHELRMEIAAEVDRAARDDEDSCGDETFEAARRAYHGAAGVIRSREFEQIPSGGDDVEEC